MKRLFVGIVFDEDFKNYLSEIQELVIAYSQKGKFHSKKNLHLTVEFIGMVPEQMIESMWQLIVKSLSCYSPFYITVNQLGYFEKKNKKILWVGGASPPILNEIQKAIAMAISQLINHTITNCYKPHITIGRQVLIETLPELDINYKYFVKEICLMESSSVSGSLEYTAIKRYKLAPEIGYL